ncbi:hypothetical protein F4820DRAFT_425497 [Hypoxylon rubiginosum]|uniref:Uncharacterized protein n=1 Tax=Hypoxylon rubiginosum TaxID=110542 RepID=A0ACB9YY20_9PEZI|nr:hypothetical protein F4820DRAFT_425497 [Hypoxylon rubiginosum]
MAQVSSATEPVAANYKPGTGTGTGQGQNGILTAADLDDIREYQKVIQFRDTIVSGKHPRIKVSKPVTVAVNVNPQQSDSLATERVAPSSSSTSTHTHALQYAPNLNTLQMDNMQSFKANSQQPAVVVATTGSTGSTSAAPTTFPRPLGSGKTGANHVSHDNPQGYKAQLQRRRQIIEEEIKVRDGKASPKTSQHSDLPGFDLSDILAKALTLVQATAPQPHLNSSNGTNLSDSGDSFDNNTFYTSSLNTPDTRPSPRVQNTASQDVQVQDATASLHQHQRDAYAPKQNNTPQPRPMPTLSYQTDLSRSAQPIQVTSSSQQAQLNNGSLPAPIHDHAVYPSKASREGDLMTQSRHIREVEAQVISSDSAAPSRSDNSGNTDSDQPADFGRYHAQHQHRLLPSAHFRQRGSPLVRAHDLSPLAPQPAHVSPLATARHPPMPEPEISILPGAPAQVTALRQERAVVISPESSPQGDKGGKKRNKKNKNKRKAETRAPDIPESPDIKPEPRSPSPLSAPQFTRPQKRLRSDTRPEQELAYGEPRIERPVSVLHREQYPAVHVQAERPSYGLEVIDDPYTQVRQSVAPASQRLDRAVYEERRPDGAAIQYVRRVQSPYGYATPFGAPLRSASYSVNPQYREVPTYQRDGRMSARPYVDRARSRSPVVVERRSPVMAPPAPPPARIIVDQYGREYIDPPRASTVARQSVVPAPRPSEREIVYERVPMRAPSRMPAETFEEDGIVYRRASPTYAPRRVITQPEYGVDYRSYRERDYSVQPLGPPGQDYAPIRGAPERRVAEDVSRDYLPRATSVRPAEALPYYGGLGTVRPEVPPRQYAASVHPEVRAAPAIREFSVRPAERDVPGREFSVRPVERYYDRPHADEEVTYIERPRAAQQEIIYADNSRRQVYQ